MKKILFILFFFLTTTANGSGIYTLSRGVCKISINHPEFNIIGSGSGFCTSIIKNGENWEMTILTAGHVANPTVKDDKENRRLIINFFYPKITTYIVDPNDIQHIEGRDLAHFKIITPNKPTVIPIKRAKKMPVKNDNLIMYGCPDGGWACVKLYTFIEIAPIVRIDRPLITNKNYLIMEPYCKKGESGAPLINKKGEYVGLMILKTSFNSCAAEILVNDSTIKGIISNKKTSTMIPLIPIE